MEYNLIEAAAYVMEKAYRDTVTRTEAVALLRIKHPEVDNSMAESMWAAIDAHEDICGSHETPPS